MKQNLKPDAYKLWEPSYQIDLGSFQAKTFHAQRSMHYVYVLRDECGAFCIGHTADLKRRLGEHRAGRNRSIRGRVWSLVYYEAYASAAVARRRERRLKQHGRVKQQLLERLVEED